MKINYTVKENLTIVGLEGRLDTVTAPELEQELCPKLNQVKELIIDMKDLVYISSAGLRVILSCQKKMNATEGKLTIKNPNELVMDIFEATGFSNILTIE